jgi:hypothetical protein
MPVVVLALADALASARHSARPWLRSYALHLPTAVVSAALALTTTLPLGALTESAAYSVPARVSAIDGLLGRIPDGATVESNIGPISRLTSRCRVFWVTNTRGVTPDFIALDNSSGRYEDPVGYAHELHPRAGYVVVGSAEGYVVLGRER